MKQIILTITIVLLTIFVNAQETFIVGMNKSSNTIMQPIALDAVQWTDGFWAERYEINNKVSLRRLWELAEDPDAGHVIDNFKAAATGKGTHEGTTWQDAWLYKWLEAAASIYENTGDKWIEERMNEAIELIAAAQEDDGYISTQRTIGGKQRFDRPGDHEVYNMGHLLTVACIHKRVTGENTLFEIGLKNADFLCETLGKKVSPSFAHNPSAIMGLVEMYRETGQKKYLDCAKLIVDSRGSTPKRRGIFNQEAGFIGTDQIQDRIPLRKSEKVVGHNVFFTYLFAGAADLFMETGDTTLLPPLERLWDDLVYHKMCINGGVSPVGTGMSIHKDRVVEAVGAPYNLPAADSYNETCGQIGNFMWNYRMLAITGDAKYADMMELELYNGFLGGIDLEGDHWFYRNSLRLNDDYDDLKNTHNFYAERIEPGRAQICCPTNLLRTFAQLQTYLYSTDKEGLWVHHYAGNTFSNEKLTLSQTTDYPWDSRVVLKIEDVSTEGQFTIRLRIPGWANNATVEVNGKETDKEVVAGSYFSITKKWKNGDQLILNVPMQTQLMVAHPKAEQLRNQVAVKRGPILYCLEGKDIPKGMDIDNVYIPSDIQFTKVKSDFPFGIQNLKGTALYQKQASWDGQLYRPLSNTELEPVPIELIPYFAYNNRGFTAMSVWLPLNLK